MDRSIRGRRFGALALACAGMLLASTLAVSLAAAQVEPEPACSPIAKTKLRLRKLDDGIGNERILFRGEMEVDESVPLDFAATGLVFQMIDDSGAMLVESQLPEGTFGIGGFGSYGWATSGGGGVWSWRDRASQVSGFKRVVIKRPTRSNRLRLVLFGQQFSYPLPVLPITVRVLFPTADGSTQLCGQQINYEVECFFRNQGNKLICR